ncbi:hypothetical protein BC826DRAFT_1187440 [Russula brevipes]|nr:hypothetical protein BC826DRAFT_1187440 [Russula brevipes]
MLMLYHLRCPMLACLPLRARHARGPAPCCVCVSRAGLPPSPRSPRAWPSPPLCLCTPPPAKRHASPVSLPCSHTSCSLCAQPSTPTRSMPLQSITHRLPLRARVACLRVACLRIPRLRIPRLRIPHLCIPRLCVPHLCIPRLCVPRLCVPRLCVPRLCVPRLCVPCLCVPRLHVPCLRVPHLHVPRLRVPRRCPLRTSHTLGAICIYFT